MSHIPPHSPPASLTVEPETPGSMPFVRQLEASGKWLFRWRSYLPIAMLVLILASLGHYAYPFGSRVLDSLWELLCFLVGIGGLVIRGLVAGYVPRHTSGRNTREQVADSLNTAGMYSLVRNPLYVGNFFMGLSVALFIHCWWVSLIYCLAFVLYYERIIVAEETFLRGQFGDAYLAWAARTPALVPRLSGWRRPPLPFSWRTAVKREYQSAYALVVTLFALEQLTEFALGNGLHVDAAWMWVVGLSTAAYLAVRLIHKGTRLLHVAGR